MSPTDPIAVLDVLKEAGAPTELELKIAGESLIKDGEGVEVSGGGARHAGAGYWRLCSRRPMAVIGAHRHGDGWPAHRQSRPALCHLGRNAPPSRQLLGIDRRNPQCRSVRADRA